MSKKRLSVTSCAKLFIEKEGKALFGTKMHKHFELYLKNKQAPILSSEEERIVFRHFISFLKDHPFYQLVAVEKELICINSNLEIVGKADAIFKNVNDPKEYIIVDWKVMKDITPDQSTYYYYIMQLYSKMLQTQYSGIRVKLFLVLLHPQRVSYFLIPFADSSTPLDQLLKTTFT